MSFPYFMLLVIDQKKMKNIYNLKQNTNCKTPQSIAVYDDNYV